MAKPFDEEGLRGFTAAGEGSPPPVFVGREDVISDILAAAERAWRPGAVRHGEPKMTRIVQGAPGSGKSSVLAELQSRLLGMEAGAAPRLLTVSSTRLTTEAGVADVLAAVAAAARTEKKGWRAIGRDVFAHIRRDVDGVSVAGAGVTLRAKDMPDPAALAALEKTLPGGEWPRPVILAVDEAQNLPSDKHTPAGQLFCGIHEADTGLPLTLVFAGLGDTPERAGELGLTRGLTLHPLGSLSDAETGDLMRGFCDRFGIETAGAEDRLTALAAPCEGWPRHLHFALQAFGAAALETGGAAARIGWDGVFAAAAGSRRAYYRAQQDMAMRESGNLVGAVMFELDRNLSAMEIISLIERKASESRPEGGWSLPPGTGARSFRRHLVHQGALQTDEAGRFHCPIPSFRSFLIDEGMAPGAVLLYSASRGDERRAEGAIEAGAGTGFRGMGGVTPLHVAAGCGRAGMVRFLLDRGADPSARDSGGRTPADTARRYKKDECAGILDAAHPPPPEPEWDDGPGFGW